MMEPLMTGSAGDAVSGHMLDCGAARETTPQHGLRA